MSALDRGHGWSHALEWDMREFGAGLGLDPFKEQMGVAADAIGCVAQLVRVCLGVC